MSKNVINKYLLNLKINIWCVYKKIPGVVYIQN